MAKRDARCQQIFNALEPTILDLGFELIDVLYIRENGKIILRLLVDKRGGINIDECELISESVDPIIEQELQLRSHDYFEVSSPGLERPLTEVKDFILYAGQTVEVRLYQKRDNKKIFTGELLNGTDQTITIKDETNGETIIFELKDVAKISRTIKF
ncbi:MAG TPA: ribosome maturation factor RimP [Clostridiaceae bacterium]|nr:ribosome maturation factor RimP [Clostridiaceae bacterium]